MSDQQDLLHRIERLEHRFEISELVTSYAVACDEHDIPRLRRLFTVDAVIDSPSKLLGASGRDEIAAMFVRMFKIRGPGFHWTHDHIVHFDENDTSHATGTVLSHAETCPNEEVSLAAMTYSDDYRRVEGRWLIQKRVLKFLYYVPAKEYAKALNGRLRVTVSGNRLPGDYPESLPAWQAFEREHGTRTNDQAPNTAT